jgi:uncharacterized protein (UPF0218 family)
MDFQAEALRQSGGGVHHLVDGEEDLVCIARHSQSDPIQDS